MRLLLLIFIGGGLGTLCRYGIGKIWELSSFPYGSLVANIISCLILGALMGFHSEHILKSETRVILMTGFCGGFSTFSTFSAELVRLYQAGSLFYAFTYLMTSVISGILAIVIGMYLMKLISA